MAEDASLGRAGGRPAASGPWSATGVRRQSSACWLSTRTWPRSGQQLEVLSRLELLAVGEHQAAVDVGELLAVGERQAVEVAVEELLAVEVAVGEHQAAVDVGELLAASSCWPPRGGTWPRKWPGVLRGIPLCTVYPPADPNTPNTARSGARWAPNLSLIHI